MVMELNKEIDTRLREVIKDQSNLWHALSLVRAFHNEKVLASDRLYALYKSVPVFTTTEDLEAFLQTESSAKAENWVKRSVLDVLEEAIRAEQESLSFNPKQEGDKGNVTKMKTADMIEFVNHHTQLLNFILSESNQKAALEDKFYLVPAHVTKTEDGQIKREFSLLLNPDKERFLPIFSNMTSFAKWYNHQDFGQLFRQRRGLMIVWKLSDVLYPKEGDNDLTDTKGVVVNPFVDNKMVDWEDLNLDAPNDY